MSIKHLIDLFELRTEENPQAKPYTFLEDGESQERSITLEALTKQAKALAVHLQEKGYAGQTALLLFPPGIDYIVSFLGCLYAGVIAVPAYPPDPNRLSRTLPRLLSVIQDAQAKLVLSTEAICSMADFFFSQAPDLASLDWIASDRIDSSFLTSWKPPQMDSNSLAFLQYTSGSTGSPKGVMLSHGNLLHNLKMIQHAFAAKREDVGVSWLPPYHDMGLIGGILEPVYAGCSTILFSPLDFLKHPIRWLKAISKYRGTISGAPNFAYEMCIRKVTEEQKSQLDLSSWTLAFSGAEPIRPETLRRFAQSFAPCGFKKEALYTCYGLAESTLIVSGSKRFEEPIIQSFSKEGLKKHRAEHSQKFEDAVELVSCGQVLPEQQLKIVDPDSKQLCAPYEIGEVWIQGESIAKGYFHQKEKTEEIFAAKHSSLSETFFKTGDLGFLDPDKKLYITGRLKDLIIINGSNHYPQDIETNFEKADAALRAGCVAAFSIESDQSEKLAVMAELEKGIVLTQDQFHNLVESIQQVISEKHEIDVHDIILIPSGSIPKTSSGKISRYACKQGFLEKTIEVLHHWSRHQGVSSKASVTPNASEPDLLQNLPSDEKVLKIQNWIQSQLSERLGITEEIDLRKPFTHFGLDSRDAVNLAGELEDWLGGTFSPTLLWEYPTIERLSHYLAGEQKKKSSPELLLKSSSTRQEPIAIIGMNGRFPKSPDLNAFWDLLQKGEDAIVEVPADRWDWKSFYDSKPATSGKMHTRWGGFLDAVSHFDATFFGISPREAARMDPQQRLLLEVSWAAFEDAGLLSSQIKGSRTGVFMGIGSHDYLDFMQGQFQEIDSYIGTGNAHSIAANRLSYVFDLRGPSVAIDTACSSSLVAIHMACQSLQNKESDMALAGGVNLILRPETTVAFSQARMMSPSGRCKTFD
ncbi:MAG: AMP-binding protein, partial [Deltaproteobacteria bacterium]|nr:AMP-binding protein [Deltaproteobacteria bacterium]